MSLPPELDAYPLAKFFLAGYLSSREESKRPDLTNFPLDGVAARFERYEKLFTISLETLALSKEALRARSEFNFNSGDAANFEGAIATLRAVESLRIHGFTNIRLVQPPGADFQCEKNGSRVCCEVKTITKQSQPRKGQFLEGQVYSKILETVGKARQQLGGTAVALRCDVSVFVCVMNWLEHSVVLSLGDFQSIVDRLEKDQEQESLGGIEGVVIVTYPGQSFAFWNERAKRLLGIA